MEGTGPGSCLMTDLVLGKVVHVFLTSTLVEGERLWY
jgi:hypothetical protein